jgi:glycine/D-amino acid oxidase-like deaminating enzyme
VSAIGAGLVDLSDADEVPVLIVGGSLVGLSTALFLAHHGVASLGEALHPASLLGMLIAMGGVGAVLRREAPPAPTPSALRAPAHAAASLASAAARCSEAMSRSR